MAKIIVTRKKFSSTARRKAKRASRITRATTILFRNEEDGGKDYHVRVNTPHVFYINYPHEGVNWKWVKEMGSLNSSPRVGKLVRKPEPPTGSGFLDGVFLELDENGAVLAYVF